MDTPIEIGSIIRIVYSSFVVYFMTKFAIWFYGYVKQVIILRKIYSPRIMIPFIGNSLFS